MIKKQTTSQRLAEIEKQLAELNSRLADKDEGAEAPVPLEDIMIKKQTIIKRLAEIEKQLAELSEAIKYLAQKEKQEEKEEKNKQLYWGRIDLIGDFLYKSLERCYHNRRHCREVTPTYCHQRAKELLNSIISLKVDE
jgi:DNA repair exonuclease SbcCD ATPase subunit